FVCPALKNQAACCSSNRQNCCSFSPARTLESGCARTFSYLLENKSYLQNRERGRMRGAGWYGYVYPKNIEVMKEQKILVPDIADRASFALDETGEYAFTSGYGITLKSDVTESVKYVLALLNSNLLDFYLKSVSTTLRGGFFRYFTQFIQQLPIRLIDFSDPADKARHDKMVELVDRMLGLNKQKHSGTLAPSQVERVDREIAATDAEIDDLVYDLYTITDEERAIIEEA
ncbi:MAG: TaqI-like C-terminal specificity domain-containing protein, partial [Terriglobia bacterium]